MTLILKQNNIKWNKWQKKLCDTSVWHVKRLLHFKWSSPHRFMLNNCVFFEFKFSLKEKCFPSLTHIHTFNKQYSFTRFTHLIKLSISFLPWWHFFMIKLERIVEKYPNTSGRIIHLLSMQMRKSCNFVVSIQILSIQFVPKSNAHQHDACIHFALFKAQTLTMG